MSINKPAKENTTNMLIIDDHKMVRDGLRVMLGSLKKKLPNKIIDAACGEEGIRMVGLHQFDIIIIDYQMPGISGAETVSRILRFKPKMKILALSNFDEIAYVQSMIDVGAKGYILKNIEPTEMLNAIKTVLADKPYYSNEVAIKLLEAAEEFKISKQQAKNILTRREIEVLTMIAMEMRNDEIGKKLFVSKRTIDAHRQNLLNKLHVKNSIGLVKVAYKLNLVSQ